MSTFKETPVISSFTKGSLAWAEKKFSPLTYDVANNAIHVKAGNTYILSSEMDENNDQEYGDIVGADGHMTTMYSCHSQTACPGWMSEAAKDYYEGQLAVAFNTLVKAYSEVV